MYYIAAIDKNDIERACDFGFDIVERIMLDECFKGLKRVPPGLIKEKRLGICKEEPEFKCNDIKGLSVQEVCNRYGVNLSNDTCFAAVLDTQLLRATLNSMWMKIYNLSNWSCSDTPRRFNLFNSVIVYDPYIMRKLLSEDKYGKWDHTMDRDRALEVLSKFKDFIDRNSHFKYIVLYNEIFCSRWDCTGELCVDPEGVVIDYNYFGEGKSYSYLYAPEVQVWQRV